MSDQIGEAQFCSEVKRELSLVGDGLGLLLSAAETKRTKGITMQEE